MPREGTFAMVNEDFDQVSVFAGQNQVATLTCVLQGSGKKKKKKRNRVLGELDRVRPRVLVVNFPADYDGPPQDSVIAAVNGTLVGQNITAEAG